MRVASLLWGEIRGLPDSVAGDVQLLRYVRSCRGDVGRAVEKLQKCLAWRQDNDVDVVRQAIIENDWSFETLPGAAELQAAAPPQSATTSAPLVVAEEIPCGAAKEMSCAAWCLRQKWLC